MTIFGVSWDELALEHVEKFLDDADDEPFLWEAKGGGERPRPRSIRKAACGFANSRGGYLIVGADRNEDETWSLNGVDFGREEPRTWVDSVIRDGLDPVPRHDTKPLSVTEGRDVAIVRIEPAGEPPCITRDGVIYLRVSGRTVPVTDALVLARLSEQGERARERAWRHSCAALEERLNPGQTFVYEPCTFVFGIALAPVTTEPRVERRLYRAETKEHASALIHERLRPARNRHFEGGSYRVGPEGALVAMAAGRFDARWTVALNRTGAVAVTCTLHQAEGDQEIGAGLLMQDVVQPAWVVASDLVATLGGSGRTALRIGSRAQITVLHRNERGQLGVSAIEDWTVDVEPSPDEIDYVRRELLRAAGFEAWEPREEVEAPGDAPHEG